MMIYIVLISFIIAMALIATDVVDKAIISMSCAIFFVLIGVMDRDTAINYIDFETIVLLMGMMMLVDIARRAGIFSWLNVKIAKLTRGNPLLILIFFLSITFVCSAFLDNVTTILLVVPITITLTSGMGLNPTIYIIGEALFSNIGGALTLIGAPSNIMIGSVSKLTFNDFIINLYIPIFIVFILTLLIIIIKYWDVVKPIKTDLEKIFIANLLIRKISYKYLDQKINRVFVAKTLFVFLLVLLGFVLHSYIHISVDIIAISFALFLLLLSNRDVSIHTVLKEVEWTTLIFFSGLFIMVGGLESVGILEEVSKLFLSITDNYLVLLLLILWSSAIISSIVDNIPFVAIMIPVIINIQSTLPPSYDMTLLWWSLSLGASLGGNATIIGNSSNIVAIDIARKNGVRISFIKYMKDCVPLTVVAMIVCSIYLIIRSNI